MPAERLYAHPAVIMDVGRVALKRGPLVYCVEEADNPGGFVQRLKIGRDAELKTVDARRSVRRHRDAQRQRHGDQDRRLDTPLPHHAAARGAGDADRPALLSLGQPRPRLDGGVDARGLSPRKQKKKAHRLSRWAFPVK